MRLSTQADYAVRAVCELARHEAGAIVQTSVIADAQHIPGSCLSKVLQELSRADLVRTHRGARGGVSLVRRPDEITVRQVYEAIEGPVLLRRCRRRVERCGEEHCATHDFWGGVEAMLEEQLDATTFAALVRRVSAGSTGAAAGSAGRR